MDQKTGTSQEPVAGGSSEGEGLVASMPVESPPESRSAGPELKESIPGEQLSTAAPAAEQETPMPQDEAKTRVASVPELSVPPVAEEKPQLPAGRFTVNVGSFRERARAERLMKRLDKAGYDAFVAEATIPGSGTWYRVSVGRFHSRQEALAFAQELKEKQGIDFFIRKLKKPKT
ncbi:MAG: SPOR domain-containing protein [Deltaproteobacteria bacterium]|nr:SPOR domain-containing protein [Deltaproteobacteria bacterium]